MTIESFKNKFGDEEGQIRWDQYCLKQKESNEYEYKKEKYNMTQEEFKNYNKSRACTLENLIRRHGQEKGTFIWDQYLERQSYTTTLEYFIERDGIEAGTKAFDDFSFKRQDKKWDNNKTVSSAEREFHDEIAEVLKEIVIEKQFKIKKDNNYKVYDFLIEEEKIIIEFNGDFRHMNPKTYKATDVHPITKYTAQETWNMDADKKLLAEQAGYKVIVVWSSDWHENSEKVINDIKKEINKGK